eukprot:Awhi_evm1s8414
MFMAAPSAHKVAEMRTQTAYVDIISTFQHQQMDDHLQQVFAKEKTLIFLPQKESFAWQFLNQSQKKGNWKCTFCEKNDIHAERQFSHSMRCEDLKNKVSRFIQLFGDIENYTNFTAVSLLLGKRIEDQKYDFDEFHIYVFITFYSVW